MHHLPNQRLLCHGSHVRNIAGLLSRGFLLPNTVAERLGIKRSDYGMLGAGEHFDLIF